VDLSRATNTAEAPTIIDTGQVPTMPPSYDSNPSLADRFRSLLRDGKSAAEAVELLANLYGALHFHIVQTLPRDLLFSLGPADKLVVKLPDGRSLNPEKILTREPHVLDPVPMSLDLLRALTPRIQLEEEAVAELMIETPPLPDPTLPDLTPPPDPLPPPDPPPIEIQHQQEPEDQDRVEAVEATPASEKQTSPQKRKRSFPRHRDWKPIRKHFDPKGKTRGRWLNPHAAATEVFNWAVAEGLTISFDAIYDGIPNFFPEWIEPDSKE
jgi:hypothetical protein